MSDLAWGDWRRLDESDGDGFQDQLHRVTLLASTDAAFAALTEDGSVVTWGFAPFGGTSPPEAQSKGAPVLEIIGNGCAFAARRDDGTVLTWGVADRGGEVPEETKEKLRDVTQLAATYFGFCAVLASLEALSQTACAVWCLWWALLRPCARGCATQICAGRDAFAVVRADGRLISWGNTGAQELEGHGRVFSSPGAFAAVMNAGEVLCWGAAEHGGVPDATAQEAPAFGVRGASERNVELCVGRMAHRIIGSLLRQPIRQNAWLSCPTPLLSDSADAQNRRLFQDLIHDQPEDPWAYIDRRTSEARTADLIHKAELKKMDEAKLGGWQQAPDLPEAPRNLEEEDGELQTEVEVLDNIRLKAHNALMKAAEDGSLEKALNLAPEQSLDQIREKAARTLLAAAEDGSLDSALRGKGMNEDELNAIRKDGPAMSSRHNPVLQKKGQDTDALRQEAAATLLKAAKDGTLEAVLSKKGGQDFRTAPGGGSGGGLQDVEGLRQQAAATLLKAAEDGTLQQVLSRRGEEDVEALRQEAAATLLQAAQDGSLEAVLKKKTGPKDLDSLRQEAASTLLRAAEDGTLQAVLSRKTGQDAESLREEAAAILLKAAEDGTLEAVLKGSAKVQQDKEQLRVRAGKILLQAANDGTLEEVLIKKSQEDTVSGRRMSVSQLGGSIPYLIPFPKTREAALALLKAAEDGSLDKAFAEAKGEDPDLENLRKAAAHTLLLAAADGRLEEVLQGGPPSLPDKDANTSTWCLCNPAWTGQDGSLDTVLKRVRPQEDMESLRVTAAESLLAAAKDGSLEKALETVKQETRASRRGKQAASGLLRAAEDGRLATALAPKDLEQMRQEPGEAALDGRLAQALSQTLSKEAEMDVEALRLAAKDDTLLAACADGRLESALKSRAEVVESMSKWAAEQNMVSDAQDAGCLANDVFQNGMPVLLQDGNSRVPEPEAKALPKAPPREDMAQLDVENVKAKACDALQKAGASFPTRIGKQDLVATGVRRKWGLKVYAVAFYLETWLSELPPESADEALEAFATALTDGPSLKRGTQLLFTLKPGSIHLQMGKHEAEATLAAKRTEVMEFLAKHGRPAEEEAELTALVDKKAWAALSASLQDLAKRKGVPADKKPLELLKDLKCQVGEKKPSTTFGQSTVTTIKPEERCLGFSRSQDPLADVAGGSLAELERKIRERNERIRRENAAMREENSKLKMMGPRLLSPARSQGSLGLETWCRMVQVMLLSAWTPRRPNCRDSIRRSARWPRQPKYRLLVAILSLAAVESASFVSGRPCRRTQSRRPEAPRGAGKDPFRQAPGQPFGANQAGHVSRSSNSEKPHLSIVICGHVDSGKSTTTGRLIFELGGLPERDLEKLKQEADRLGKGSFAFAFFMDRQKEERERGVTIACTTKEFFTEKWHYTIIDAPGHRDFIKNMITGASQADVALIMVPADGNFTTAIAKGNHKAGEIQGQTRQHSRLINLLGVKQICIGVNKMDCDTAGYKQARYDEIANEMKSMLVKVGWKKDFIEKSTPVMPISGWMGDNLLKKSENMGWWKGQDVEVGSEMIHVDTVYDVLDKMCRVPERPISAPMRMPISGIYKIKGVGDVLAGRVEQGVVKPGEEVVFLPTHTTSNPCTGKVFTVEMHHQRVDFANPGDNVGLNIKGLDKNNMPRSGDVMVYKKDTTLGQTKEFDAQIQVLDIPNEIKVGYSPIGFVRCGRAACRVSALKWKMGKETGGKKMEDPHSLKSNEMAQCSFQPQQPLVCDTFKNCEGLSRVAFMDGNGVVMLGKVVSCERKGEGDDKGGKKK
eukprot:g6113.t1